MPGLASFGALLALVALGGARAEVNVVTYHNDNARTGQNLHETMLTPASVSSDRFGKLFSCPVDGWVFAQPLYLAKVTVPGRGTHNIVFVATAHGSVYAFDADNSGGANGAPLWHTSFINPAAGVTSVPIDDYNLPDPPELCITGTPVIDAASSALYVVAQTKETGSGYAKYLFRLHALDVRTGAEKPSSPVIMAPAAPGRGAGSNGQNLIPFEGFYQLQRPGLLLVKGVVYAAFGSIGDLDTYHGWVLGFDANSLGLLQVFNDTPNGSQGGIWMSGAGPAVDAAGNLYCITGNGTFDADGGGNDYGNSVIRLTPRGTDLLLTDYFTPYNQADLEANDGDLGSGGALVLPDSMGSTNHPHLLIGAGKTGAIYLLDRDNLGHYHEGDDSQIVQSTEPGALPWGLFAAPACLGNRVYFHGPNDVLKAYEIAQARMSAEPVSEAEAVYGYPGATPSISADGTNNAIVWEVETSAYVANGPALLRAYDAQDLARELYNSSQAGARDQLGAAHRFTVPTIANGKVYVTAGNELTVFGALGTPTITAQPPNLAASPQGTVTLRVAASGDAPLSYQWQFNGADLAGATNAVLTLRNLQPSQTGQYNVVVSNALGSVSSAPATLNLLGLDYCAVLTLFGPVGTAYRIDYVSDLASATNWTVLTNIVLTTNPTVIVDRQSAGAGKRFYRSVLLPEGAAQP